MVMKICVVRLPSPCLPARLAIAKDQAGQPPAEMNHQSRNVIAHQPHPGLHGRCSRPPSPSTGEGNELPSPPRRTRQRERAGREKASAARLTAACGRFRKGVAPRVVVKAKPESTRKQKGNRNVIPIKHLDHFAPERRSGLTDKRRLPLRTESEGGTARSHKLAGNSIFSSHFIFCIYGVNFGQKLSLYKMNPSISQKTNEWLWTLFVTFL